MNRIDIIIKESIDSVVRDSNKNRYNAWRAAMMDMSKDDSIKGNFKTPRDIRNFEEYLRSKRDNNYYPGQEEDY